MLDPERCSFLRRRDRSAAPGSEASPELACWAAGQPRPIAPSEQRRRCFTVAHTACPDLETALGARAADGWSANGRAVGVVAEACHLAEARLEVRAEAIGPVLARIFGDEA